MPGELASNQIEKQSFQTMGELWEFLNTEVGEVGAFDLSSLIGWEDFAKESTRGISALLNTLKA